MGMQNKIWPVGCLVWGVSAQGGVWSWEVSGPRGVWSRGVLALGGVWSQGDVWSRGVCLVPGGVSGLGGVSTPRGVWYPSMHWGRHPPVNRMTDRCKNITLATTSLRPVNIFQPRMHSSRTHTVCCRLWGGVSACRALCLAEGFLPARGCTPNTPLDRQTLVKT